MNDLTCCITEHASALEEGTPICPQDLLHLGHCTAVDQALSYLVQSDELIRVYQGVYMLPVYTKFGPRRPLLDAAINGLSSLWGEVIVPSGGSAANCLGLTTQNVVRPVFLTSGPSRTLKFWNFTVRLRHASHCQLAAPNSKAGEVIRALLWLGENEINFHLITILPTLSNKDRNELLLVLNVMPNWLADAVSNQILNG